MDPEQQPRPISPEQNPNLPPSPERQSSPEQQVERPQFDSESTSAEQAPVQSSAALPIDPATIAVPQVPVPINTDDQAQVSSDDGTPLLASDDDLIEKEWVDKAKQVIADTKDDPNRREREIAKLQADYLRKRYGKELGVDENA